MTLEQLLSNIRDIQATYPGPYYIGRGLAKALQDSCRFSKASVNANREETVYFGVSEEIDLINFVVRSNSDPKDFLVFVAGPEGFAEIEIK